MLFKNSEGIPRDVNLAIWGVAISWFFWGPGDAYYSLLLKSFGISYAQIGLLLSLSQFFSLFLAVYVGFLADSFSPRKLVLYSLVAYMSFPILIYFAGLYNSILILIITLISNGIIRVVRNISMTAYIKDKTPPELSTRVWSNYEALTIFGWGLGMGVGGLIIHYFKLYELYLIALIGLLIKLYLFYIATEPDLLKKKSKEEKKGNFKVIVDQFKSLDIQIFHMLFMSFLMAFTLGNIDAFISLFAESLNFGLPTIGFLMFFVYSAFIFAIPLKKVSDKIGKLGSIVIGQIIMLAMIILMVVYVESYWWIMFIVLFLHWIGFLLVKPIRDGILGALTPRKMQGEISGIQFFIVTLGVVLGSVFFGYIGDIMGLKYIFIITAFIYFILLLEDIYLMNKYEKHLRDITLKPHSHYLTMFHIGHAGHSIPNHMNPYMKKGK